MKITLATITAFVSLVSSLAIPSAHILEKRNTYTNVTYSGTAFQNSMLSIHNGYRAHHGVGNLTWNSTLALKAYNTSSQCIFRHSSSTPYGENVGAGSSNFNNPTYFVTLYVSVVDFQLWKLLINVGGTMRSVPITTATQVGAQVCI